MKNLMVIGLFLLTACSPYKKIVITMSKIQTENWIDKSESNVISKLGPYKTKTLNETGYILLFDYSSYNHTPQKAQPATNYEPKMNASVGRNRQLIQPTTYVTTSAKPGLDVNQFEIIREKAMKFYFDKNKNVIYVDAIGYPDSVRYELRKK